MYEFAFAVDAFAIQIGVNAGRMLQDLVSRQEGLPLIWNRMALDGDEWGRPLMVSATVYIPDPNGTAPRGIRETRVEWIREKIERCRWGERQA